MSPMIMSLWIGLSKVAYFKAYSTVEKDFFKAQLLNPPVAFVDQVDFSWESFIEIHFYTDSSECSFQVILCSWANVEECAKWIANSFEQSGILEVQQ